MLVAANWKMNCTKAEAKTLVSGLKSAVSGKNEVVLCPPFTILSIISDEIAGSKLKIGAQNCHYEEKGAFTGEISPKMLKDIGVSYVIIGHSERRAGNNETNELVNKKSAAAIASGLIPIICIGETGEERKAGKTKDVILSQIAGSLPEGSSYVIAYEPVWAIGTGVTPTSKEIEEAMALINSKKPGIKILYGGSVTDSNCEEISKISNVSGFLVGGASLDVAKFSKIMNV